MGKKEQNDREKVEAVLELLRKQSPLTLKQEKFCNNACVKRFLKAKGDSVKQAAKHLRACLSWRESFGTEHLIADEFSDEMAEGIAYVAGHDDESRPVMVFRIKQEYIYPKLYSQKLYTRLLVFTLEVAIGSMSRNVEQFILLFDASFARSSSAFMNVLLVTLKIVSEYYPERLYKAFVIDPPSLFSFIWKGIRPFVELSTVTMVVSSLDFEDSLDYEDFSSTPENSSFRYDPSSITSTPKVGSSSSSRFSFTVSHNFNSLKPWYLSLTPTETSSSKVGPTMAIPSPSLLGPALISPLNSRSLSFASPAAARTPSGIINSRSRVTGPTKKNNSNFASTPLPHRINNTCNETHKIKHRTSSSSRISYLQSPAVVLKRDCYISRTTEKKARESFLPFLKFYRRQYNEIVYRSNMRRPTHVASQLKRRHVSASQRF